MKTKIIAGLFTILALISIAGYQLAKTDNYQLFGTLITNVDTTETVVALTFDDGPVPVRTSQILEILESENIKATFFVNGNSLKKHPGASRLLLNSGHEIGNHSYSHKRMIFMSYQEVAQELEDTEALIRSFGYEGTLRFRPPFGKKLFMLPLYLSNNNIETIMWDVEPETWTSPRNSIEDRINRGIKETKNGSIIIMHVMHGNNSSMHAITPMIRGLKDKGFRFVTVSELLSYQ